LVGLASIFWTAGFFPDAPASRLRSSRTAGKKKDPAMSAQKQQNLQDVFLNYVRKNKLPCTVFLMNGVKLQGVITWFDNFSILLRRDGHSQLVYKHAISTVMPSQPVMLWDGPDEASVEEEASA
jgi:host factor-I protein